MQNERKQSLDIIRIVAISMVLMIHVTAYMVSYFRADYANEAFVVGNIFNGLARGGTPLFLMLTGALLLNEDRKEKAFEFYLRKLLPLLLLLIFWLLFYSAWRGIFKPLLEQKPIDTELFVDYLLWQKGRGQRFNHLWYLFMVIGAYVMIPVLRLFVKRENKNYILGIIIFCVIVQFAAKTADVFTIGAEHTVAEYLSRFHLEYATGYFPYLLIGWYLSTFKPNTVMRIILIVLGLAALLVMILAVQFKIESISAIRDYVVEMNTLPAMIYGVGLFTLFDWIGAERATRSKFTAMLSKLSFGVYVTHVVFLDILVTFILPYNVFNEQHAFLYVIVVFLIDFVVSYLFTFVLSLIKGVRKIVKA